MAEISYTQNCHEVRNTTFPRASFFGVSSPNPLYSSTSKLHAPAQLKELSNLCWGVNSKEVFSGNSFGLVIFGEPLMISRKNKKSRSRGFLRGSSRTFFPCKVSGELPWKNLDWKPRDSTKIAMGYQHFLKLAKKTPKADVHRSHTLQKTTSHALEELGTKEKLHIAFLHFPDHPPLKRDVFSFRRFIVVWTFPKK